MPVLSPNESSQYTSVDTDTTCCHLHSLVSRLHNHYGQVLYYQDVLARCTSGTDRFTTIDWLHSNCEETIRPVAWKSLQVNYWELNKNYSVCIHLHAKSVRTSFNHIHHNQCLDIHHNECLNIHHNECLDIMQLCMHSVNTSCNKTNFNGVLRAN